MAEKKAHIMYVEDDEVLGFVTKDNLEINGYQVSHFLDGKAASKSFSGNVFDLCIVDVMLPEMDGFTLAEEIRKKNQEIPILFLTAKSLKEDRIKGLLLGADDYITKPFSIEELILKIEIFLKRKHIQQRTPQTIMSVGQYEFDHPNLKLKIGEEEKNLTQKEGDLLQLLIENKGNILKRNVILERLWGENDYFHGRSMDVFISRLRKYLKADASIKIENVHGVGFRLVV
jgi:DNA-binding response OmpR family regulator